MDCKGKYYLAVHHIQSKTFHLPFLQNYQSVSTEQQIIYRLLLLSSDK
jgi:hypothetical protein